MNSNFLASRRFFLLGIGSVARLGLVSGRQKAAASPSAREPVIAYVGGNDCIEVFEITKACWRKRQVLPSRSPSCLVLDTVQRRLFVVNHIADYEGLPTGSVESYSVGLGDGSIELISRRPLALSAILPRHLALAPDGKAVVVAVYGGGAYNVLPVSEGGELGRVSQVIKEIGSGLHLKEQATAHPHSVAFHPGGRFLVTTDFGSDRLSVFAYADRRLERIQIVGTRSGSGPSHVAFNPDGDLLCIAHQLSAELSHYTFDEVDGIATPIGNQKVSAIVTGFRASGAGIQTSFGPQIPIALLHL